MSASAWRLEMLRVSSPHTCTCCCQPLSVSMRVLTRHLPKALQEAGMVHTVSVKQLAPLCLSGTRHRLLRCESINPSFSHQPQKASGVHTIQVADSVFRSTGRRRGQPYHRADGEAQVHSPRRRHLQRQALLQPVLCELQAAGSHHAGYITLKATPSAASLSTCVKMRCTHESLHMFFS